MNLLFSKVEILLSVDSFLLFSSVPLSGSASSVSAFLKPGVAASSSYLIPICFSMIGQNQQLHEKSSERPGKSHDVASLFKTSALGQMTSELPSGTARLLIERLVN